MHFKRIDGCLCRIEEVSGHSIASCNSIVNLNEKEQICCVIERGFVTAK